VEAKQQQQFPAPQASKPQQQTKISPKVSSKIPTQLKAPGTKTRTPTKNSQKAPNPAKLHYQQLQAEEETELKTHHNNNNNNNKNNKNQKPKTLGEKKKENLHYTQSLSHSTN